MLKKGGREDEWAAPGAQCNYVRPWREQWTEEAGRSSGEQSKLLRV